MSRRRGLQKIGIEKDKPQELPSPGGRGVRGGGQKKVIMHPHPGPLPSRERGNWVG